MTIETDALQQLYNSYATQAIFYHIALLTLITPLIPTKTLVPSHKVSLWISTDPFSPVYSEESFSLRTHLAHVEHQLFVLLPRWLELVTVEEANRLEVCSQFCQVWSELTFSLRRRSWLLEASISLIRHRSSRIRLPGRSWIA